MIKDKDELLNYNNDEERILEASIRAISQSGANVVVSGGSISELALHFLEKYNLMAIKVTSKFDLRRVCFNFFILFYFYFYFGVFVFFLQAFLALLFSDLE